MAVSVNQALRDLLGELDVIVHDLRPDAAAKVTILMKAAKASLEAARNKSAAAGAAAKGRSGRKPTVTDEVKAAILAATGTVEDIVRQFGVSSATVTRIRREARQNA